VNKFATIFKYIKHKKADFFLYLFFNILSVLFSVLSLGAIGPFMKLLFKKEGLALQKPQVEFSSKWVYNEVNYWLSQVIAEPGGRGPMKALLYLCLIVLVSVFFKNLFLYLGSRVLVPIRNYVMNRLRNDLYRKIITMPVGYFTEKRKGDLMARMSNDIYEVEASVLSTMDGLIKDPLNIIGYLLVLFFLSYQLTLFIFVLFPLIGLLIGRLSRSLRKDSGTLQKKYGYIMNVMDETLGNMRIIKAFTAENFMTGKFVRLNQQVDKVKTTLTNRKELASPLSEFLGVLVLCMVFWYGGRIILDKSGSAMDADQFISYIAIFGLMINPAKSLSTSFYNLQKGSAAAERIEQILLTPDVIVEKENPVIASGFRQSIEFKNVSFKYDDTTILNNISFVLPKGTTIALVGSSGAGKSTLADLLPRFHDVSEGEILLDGVNIKNYSINSLRSMMGIVTQEPLLFNDSVRSNIALGVDNPQQKEIEHAASIANAHNFIIQKEEGYNSNIGERGNKLSGGEKQRLTIARAVFKNPPILILDEATSSLDTESERLVQDAIDNLMQERTSLVIAHRLSTVRHANLILVLQKGNVVERGTHDELLAAGGFYKRLVEMQEVK